MIVKVYQRASVSPGGKVSASSEVSLGGDSAGFLHHCGPKHQITDSVLTTLKLTGVFAFGTGWL